MKCDFCENESIGVYSTDFAPISLAYCVSCLRVPNIRTKFQFLFAWARLGDKVFNNEHYHNPMVFHNNIYITGLKYISELTEIEINNTIGENRDWVKNAVFSRFNDKNFEYYK